VVIPNIWCDLCLSYSFYLALTFCRGVLHDPVAYPEPEEFKPERFINPDGTLREDPVLTSLYGFGKRICSGRHLADASMFISIASLLSVFSVKKGTGADGGPDTYLFTGGAVRCGYRVLSGVLKGLLQAFSLLAVRALSPTPLPQGIEGLKSLSSPIPGLHELFWSLVYLVFLFFSTNAVQYCA
jgi:hypothetical protein